MYPDIPEMAVFSNFSGAALATVSPLIPAYILALGANWVPWVVLPILLRRDDDERRAAVRGVTTGPRRPNAPT